LDRCNKLEKLIFNAKIKINEGLKDASNEWLFFQSAYRKINARKQSVSLYDIAVTRLARTL
jgi:hypothetical protein